MTEVLRFAGVGGLATLCHVVVAYLSFAVFAVPPQAANLAGFAAAVGISYVGNSRWTFSVNGPDTVFLPRFLGLSLIGLAVSAGVTGAVTGLGFPYLVALAAVAMTVPPMTFLGSKYLVFDDARTGSASLALPLALCAGTLVWIAFSGQLLNHDTAWYLVAARKWLAGAQLYTDIVEVNPPLGFYLALPALALAEAFGMSDSQGQIALMALATAASVGWTARLVLNAPHWTKLEAVAFACIAGLAVTLPFTSHFAQREHLMVLMLLPWITGALVRPDGLTSRHAVPRAAVAAIGICLKPFFLAYPLFLTLWDVARTRSLKPAFSTSNLVIGLIGLAYVAFVAVWHPAYFAEIVPNARATYGAYGLELGVILSNSQFGISLVALAALVSARTGGALGAALLAAGLAYAVQWTGFSYQAGPVLAFACLSIAVAVIRRPAALTIASACAALVVAGAHVRETGRYQSAFADILAPEILRLKGQGAQLTAWSTELNAGFPLALEAGAEWQPTAPALWYLPAALPALADNSCSQIPGRCAHLTQLVEDTRAEMFAHLACSDVLIVDREMPYLSEKGFDLAAILGDRHDFATAFAAYEPLISDRRFDVLIRRDACPTE